jgi:hypothetical protein
MSPGILFRILVSLGAIFMQRIPVNSSQLQSVGYEPSTNTLEVEFTDGAIYQYAQVPLHIYEELISADSKGNFFHDYIRPQYSFRRIK